MISTRGAGAVSPSEAILRGLAPDGGLYVPEDFPNFQPADILTLARMDYRQRAVFVLSRFLTDFTPDEISAAVSGAYADRFDCAEIAPLVSTQKNTYALELFHGPTLAFKDMALQLLPRLLTMSARKNGETRTITILVATSGDTGKAALEGFLDVPGTECCVFYPKEGVSAAQKLQMVTTGGSNTHVVAVEGNFDDAQSGVKRLFADKAFAGELEGRVLSSANSINFGRLVPQIVYYFSAYADLLARGEIEMGEEVNFCVPTGNFGDILAADYAKKSGLPVGRLICASNENNVLTDFIETGCYDISARPFYKTITPSMDILISSNLERLLFDLSGRDGAYIAKLMQALARDGRYTITDEMKAAMQRDYAAGFVDQEGVRAEIRRMWQEEHYLMDTHTAVASAVLRAYREKTGDARKSVVVSTASPYKFGASVLDAISGGEKGADDFACCRMLAEKTGTALPEQIRILPELPVRHRASCTPEGMKAAVMQAVGAEN